MRLKKFCSAAILLYASSLCSSAKARADTFTFTSGGVGYAFSASGTLTGVADPSVSGAFDITGGFGQVNGVAMTLVNPGTTAGNNVAVTYTDSYGTAYYNYDNVVYTNGSALDLYGLLFADGGDHTNFFAQNGQTSFTNDEANTTSFPITFSVTDTSTSAAVTPEPSSMLLLATGMLGTAVVLRRRLA